MRNTPRFSLACYSKLTYKMYNFYIAFGEQAEAAHSITVTNSPKLPAHLCGDNSGLALNGAECEGLTLLGDNRIDVCCADLLLLHPDPLRRNGSTQKERLNSFRNDLRRSTSSGRSLARRFSIA